MFHGGVLKVEVLGEVDLHAWMLLDSFDSGAYGLFIARSAAMEWSGVSGSSSSKTWGLHEAWLGRRVAEALFSDPDDYWDPDRPDDDYLAHAEVGIASPMAPLPLIPVAECLASVVGRLGTLRLTGLRARASELSPEASERGIKPLMLSLGWFDVADPRGAHRASVRIRPGSGAAPFDYDSFVATVGTWDLEHFGIARGSDGLSVTLPERSVTAAAWIMSLVAYTSGVFGTGGASTFADEEMGCIELLWETPPITASTCL